MPTEPAYYLSESDRKVLTDLIAEFRGRSVNTPRSTPGDDTVTTPEVYVVLTPSGGIPAMGAITPGTGSTGDDPGSAECRVYRMLTGGLAYCGFSRTIYNLSDTAVRGNDWYVATRDKFGTWYIPPGVSSSSGGGGSGSLTVTTVDGSPSYTGITTLRLDEVDGFVLTNPSAGIARIDIAAAGISTTGVITASAQTIDGPKTFDDLLTVNDNEIVNGINYAQQLALYDQTALTTACIDTTAFSTTSVPLGGGGSTWDVVKFQSSVYSGGSGTFGSGFSVYFNRSTNLKVVDLEGGRVFLDGTRLGDTGRINAVRYAVYSGGATGTLFGDGVDGGYTTNLDYTNAAFIFASGICTQFNTPTFGDLLYCAASPTNATWRRLPIGTSGQVLTVVSGAAAWSTPTSGTISGSTVTTGTGIMCGDGATVQFRTLTAPAAGFTITNPTGAAGNPTFALADDLAGLEAMSGTGLVARTAANTYAQRTITGPAAGISVANGGGVAGDPTLALANDLAALEGLGGTGIAVRTAADTWAQRTIVSADASVTITNPGGVGGNIDLSVSATAGKACGGRLSLSSTEPVPTANIATPSTLYFLPYTSNEIALYTGSAWVIRTFAAPSVTISGLNGLPRDVFAYDSSGTVTLELTAWSSGTARATALTTQDGVLVRSGAATRRYLGTIGAARFTGSVWWYEDNPARRSCWNYYNRVPRALRYTQGTTSWTLTSTTFRVANASAAYIDFVIGYPADAVDVTLAVPGVAPAVQDLIVAIGLDSATAKSAASVGNYVNYNGIGTIGVARYNDYPGIGDHYLAWLERVTGGTGTINARNTDREAGMSGWMMC